MTGSHRFVVMGGDYMRADAGGYDPLLAAGAGLRSGETSTPFTL